MSRFVSKLSFCSLLIALATFCLPSATAQDTMAKSAGAASSAAQVTGCLQKGNEAGGYTITGEDGKVWELRSKSVDLSQHVGHKVKVSGHAHQNSQSQESKMQADESKEANGQSYQDLSVTSLKMVSDSCQ
jgi:hypothetical protein